jgi:signal transduction histidine kinase
VGRLRDALGIRLIDVGATLAVVIVVELNVATAGGPGAAPLNPLAYVLGGILALPVLFRRKWPLQVLIACTVLLLVYYSAGYRRNISPAPLLSLPLYDAALAGYLAVAIVIPAVYMTIGVFVVDASTHPRPIDLVNEFLPSVVVLALAIMLGDTVRSRRALAAETADRLRLAEEERETETARRLAEERLRIARELHDTVAHSMATITVQAGSALHLLAEPGGDPGQAGGDPGQASAISASAITCGAVQAALIAIRDTSKGALSEIRITLGQLRNTGGQVDAAEVRTAGLDRLTTLSDAVRAAGAPVTVTIEGEQVPLDPSVDHAAYRILQESLTNVLRHAGPQASATIRLRYGPEALTIEVTDDGAGPPADRFATPAADPSASPPADPSASPPADPSASPPADPSASPPAGPSAAPPAGPSAAPPAGPAAEGNGSSRAGQAGHGLTGMAERAAAVGGELTAGPGAAGGFTVLARLPVNAVASRS